MLARFDTFSTTLTIISKDAVDLLYILHAITTLGQVRSSPWRNAKPHPSILLHPKPKQCLYHFFAPYLTPCFIMTHPQTSPSVRP